MSEDPVLTGALVSAYVNGMQNSSAPGVAEAGPLLMGACCKHYAVYNVEKIPTDRTLFDANVNARDLWETYAPVFESCIVGGHSQSVMCSYNSINGVPTCASYGLLTTMLRGLWNFSGFVVSDYDAWANIQETHHYAPDVTGAAVAGLSAGMDQEGGGGPLYPPVQTGIPLAVAAGRLTMAQVEQAVRRLLRCDGGAVLERDRPSCGRHGPGPQCAGRPRIRRGRGRGGDRRCGLGGRRLCCGAGGLGERRVGPRKQGRVHQREQGDSGQLRPESRGPSPCLCGVLRHGFCHRMEHWVLGETKNSHGANFIIIFAKVPALSECRQPTPVRFHPHQTKLRSAGFQILWLSKSNPVPGRAARP